MKPRSRSSTSGVVLFLSLAAGCGGSGAATDASTGTEDGTGTSVGTGTSTKSGTSAGTGTSVGTATSTGTSTDTGTSAGSESGSDSGSSETTGSSGDTSSGTDTGTGSSEGSGSTSGGMSGLPVDLGTAGDFVILAKSGISTVPMSVITGDLGLSPAAATYITGFALTLDVSNEFSTSAQVIGNIYASDYSPPTPALMTTAVSDMEAAFTDAAGRAPDVIELGAGDISGMSLNAGVYKWGTGLVISTDVTLDGDSTDVWIFQVAQDLLVANATSIVLSGGAVPSNVFWQVSGYVDLGTTAHFEGVVLTQTAVTLGTGASVDGRLLAQTSVDIDASTVAEPAP